MRAKHSPLAGTIALRGTKRKLIFVPDLPLTKALITKRSNREENVHWWAVIKRLLIAQCVDWFGYLLRFRRRAVE